MSFNDLKLADLKSVADNFGVEIPEKISKNDLILLLEEEGVSFQMYEKFVNADKTEIDAGPAPARINIKKEDAILVRMDRANYSYQIATSQGVVTFTAEHPFVAVPASVAQEIFDYHAGFRPATPREVQEYYS